MAAMWRNVAVRAICKRAFSVKKTVPLVTSIKNRRNFCSDSSDEELHFKEEHASFPGSRSKFTHSMDFLMPHALESIPVYRVLDREGKIQEPEHDPQLGKELLLKIYRKMLSLHYLDYVMYESQRQGRISFYMTNSGEEALQLGSAVALDSGDFVFAQYREAGVIFWRGFSLYDMMSQCYGNKDDLEKGRNMPVHYGSRDLNFVTISSTLATQLPQAAGAAYALKRAGNGQCVACYFGEGAASEGDAHAAFNFAATLECPVLFICRNNGYAISTSVDEQYRGDGIASRGPGYGMPTIRVDGNDLFAVYNAVKASRQLSVSRNSPVLIEAMTYRVGHHSTSDDSSVYRPTEEVSYWKESDNPITRLKRYMNDQGYLHEEEDAEWNKEAKAEVMREFVKADKVKKGNPELLFTDVYDEMPKNLKRQLEDMKEHVSNYEQYYPLQEHEPMDLKEVHSDHIL